MHYLYLIADSCILLAEMVIKYKNLPVADSYYASIGTLGEYGVIPADFAYDFTKIASFRNFLAHHYEKVDYVVVREKSLNKLDDIKSYLEFIKTNLQLSKLS